jgi:hypothetical protein
MYDVLSAGKTDGEEPFSLLAAELPQAVDGPEAHSWIAEHDVIDREILDKALAGIPAGQAGLVRDACARWSRMRFAINVTACPRPDATGPAPSSATTPPERLLLLDAHAEPVASTC